MQPGLQRIIWLASFPKSGNTWMRTFLATYFLGDNRNIDINSLREFTLSEARHDFFMRATGGTHPADADVPTYMRARVKALRLIAGAREGTHFVKTHQILDQVDGIPLIPPELTAAAIYIMRNPFDIVPSFARHTSASIDDTIAQMTNPANILGSTSGTYDILGRWDDHVASWTQAPGLPLAVVRYEDLLTNPRNGFQPVFDFLKVRPEPAKLKKTIRATSFASLRKQEDEKGFVERPAGMEKFFHSGRAGGWRDVLTDAQVGVLHREFRPALEKWYPELVAETEQIAGRAGA